MKIKDLIRQLKTYENQEADIIITMGNEDEDTFSTKHWELFSDTSMDYGYIELFCDENARQQA